MTMLKPLHIGQSILKIAQDRMAQQALEHWNSLGCGKLSYLGFNFQANKVESVKLYLTQFSSDLMLAGQDWNDIDEWLTSIWPFRSPYADQQYSNGGGLTYSIKINAEGVIEHGAYLRCFEHAPHTFPDGYEQYPGLYFCSSQGQTNINSYAYSQPALFRNKPYGEQINWAHIQGVEIAKTNRNPIQKHIFLGSEEALMPALMNKIPDDIMQFRNDNQLQFVCPAFGERGEFTSVYATKFSTQSQLPSLQSLIL